jgi:hypothetical protein
MVKKMIAHLENAGYTYVSHNEEESSSKRLLFRGTDERGFFLEFLFTPEDDYLMDRAVGSKYWDIVGKVELK